MASDIIKVQRPLFSTDPSPKWLLIGEPSGHVLLVAGHLIPQAVKDAMGKDDKAYFNGTWLSESKCEFGERVKDQPW